MPSAARAVVMVAPARLPPMSRRDVVVGGFVCSGIDFSTVDEAADIFAGQRARQLALDQPVDDLDALDVARVAPRVEELPIERQIVGHVGEERAERRAL